MNPELKLLQYDIGKPIVAEETVDNMLEKGGTADPFNTPRSLGYFKPSRH